MLAVRPKRLPFKPHSPRHCQPQAYSRGGDYWAHGVWWARPWLIVCAVVSYAPLGSLRFLVPLVSVGSLSFRDWGLSAVTRWCPYVCWLRDQLASTKC